MLAHILPCALEAELLTLLVYVASHARELIGLLAATFGGRL